MRTPSLPHRRARPLLALVALLVPASVLAQPADWPHPSELTAAPIAIEAPEPTRAVLGNGMVVYLAEDPTLPIVQGVAYVGAPGLYEPEGQEGVAGFTAALLREGGAGGRTPDEIDLTLERLAASVEASSSDVLASVGFSSLTDTLDEVLPIWRDVLVRPDFDPARIEVQRQRQVEAIRRVVDDPVQLAVRAWQARVSAGHPAGRFATVESVQAIARDDLVAFHQAWYGPSVTVLAVTGAFDTKAMIQRLDELFGDWDAEVRDPPDLPPYDGAPEARVFLAQKDLEQSILILGTPAMLAYQDPYAAFTVANEILGAGGFSSRLFTEIRTRRGLAYATGSQLSQGFLTPGLFLAYAFTRADRTGEVLGLLLDELDRLREDGVTQAELDRAVATIVNRSVFRDASVAAVTHRTARVELLGLPDGYYADHLARMQALAPDDVRAAAQRVIRPENLIVLIVGNEAAFGAPLEVQVPVERIEID
jgi:predicted Zn-dependent peptidase